MKTLKEVIGNIIYCYATIGVYEIRPDSMTLKTINPDACNTENYLVVSYSMETHRDTKTMNLFVMPDIKDYSILNPYLVRNYDSNNKPNYSDTDVNHPQHYNHGKYETFTKLQAILSPQEYRGFLKGNIIKYMDRADYKGHKEEDLAKADRYMEELLKMEDENE